MNNRYVVKGQNVKNIIAYILLGIVVVGYGMCMFKYMPIVGIIASGITLVVLALYLIGDIFKMTKKSMFVILGVAYAILPIGYWLTLWFIKTTEGKDIVDIFLGLIMSFLFVIMSGALIVMLLLFIKNMFFDE